jgi:integrase
MRMNLKRNRYQTGSLTIEERKAGPAVWIYRWRATDANGKRIRRKVVIGTKAQFATRTAVKKHVANLALDINVEVPTHNSTMTIGELVEHYRAVELVEGCGKTLRTIEVYEQHIRKYILPKWSECDISQVKAVALEAWLKALSGAPATKAKTRNVLSSIYQHARRCEFIATNPVSLVRQSAVRLKEPEVLTPEEVNVLLDELVEPARTIVHLAATTGIRRGELFGLQWQDVDLEHGRLKIVRSIVDQSVGDTKTRGSKRPLPISDDMVAALSNWRSATDYGRDEDWVFASPQLLGEKPYWPNALLIRHVLPAADRAGITKRVGWHTFRHTFATLLQSSGAGVKVTQELLRHSSPVMTLGTYAQAVTADKREAQAAVAALYLNASKRETATQDEYANGPLTDLRVLNGPSRP